MAEVRVDPSPRWVRVFFGGTAVGDSKRMRLLYEPGKLPLYCFPEEDVRTDLLSPGGKPNYLSLRVGDRAAEDAAWRFEAPELQGLIAFDWNSMDNWYEEDDEIFVHPRDPYKRIDVLRSTRHVQVIVGGEVIADSHRPSLLFETHLPVRYYLPHGDVRMDLLTPSDSHTRCPYKGVASYWSATVGGRTWKDVVWSYPVPHPQCPKIEQLLCFFNERVDAIHVDGQPEVKPVTKWAEPPS